MVEFNVQPSRMSETGDPIIDMAQKDFDRAMAWEDYCRKMFLLDWKFHNADSDNNYQWPDDIRKDREVDSKPILTINQTRQHNLLLVNEIVDNQPSISIRPTGNGATKAASEIWEGIVRRIEYQSQAADAYETAAKFAVTSGIGYWRVFTDWEAPDSFNQNIYIGPVNDPLGILMDPDIEQKDGSDAKFCFNFRKVLKDEIKARYPRLAGLVGTTPLGFNDSWVDKDYCMEAEYWVRNEVKDTLYEFTDHATGKNEPVLKSKLPEEIWKKLDESGARKRSVRRDEVMWYLLVGDQVAERKRWPGRYIPIVRFPGEEFVIDGILDRRGHTRAMKDPQRMYNFWTSGATEHVALQSKVPWVAAAESTEGYEYMWDTANNVNYSVLTYNALADDGVTPIPPPRRADPPVMAQGFIQGMEIAQQQLMSVTGQQEAAMGKADNERTGAAIQGRQQRSDTATSHYMRNFGMAKRFTGKIILDLVPKIYDVERVTRILAENGQDTEVKVNPHAPQMLDQEANGMKLVFNPNLGNFAVEADIGPGYATKREQSFAAFTQILTQAPELTSLIGDIMLREGDFPGAEEASERMKRMVPPQAMGQGPTKQELALQQQLQQANALIQRQHQELSIAKLNATNKGDLRDVEAYNAETQRLKVLKDELKDDPSDLAALVKKMIHETLATTLLNPITQTTNSTPPLAPWGGPGAPPMAQPMQQQNPSPVIPQGPQPLSNPPPQPEPKLT